MKRYCITLWVLLAVGHTASAASFDCAQATTEAEKTVCADATLSRLDEALAAAYRAAQERLGPDFSIHLKGAQRLWLQERDKCGDSRLCLDQSYRLRIQALARGAQPPPLQPAAAPIVTEAEKRERIRQILEHFTPHLNRKLVESPTFCEAFLRDLKQGRDVEFIEPVLRTDDPNHPGLERYHMCKEFWRVDNPYRPAEDPPNAYAFLLADIGQRAFRLYRVDVDNNPRNGVEEYLYAEPDFERWESNVTRFAGYHRVDLKRCLLLDGVPASALSDRLGNAHDNYNAIVRYAGRHYVLDLARFGSGGPDQGFYMRLWNFEPNIRRKAETIPCAWDTLRKFGDM